MRLYHHDEITRIAGLVDPQKLTSMVLLESQT